MCYLHGAELAPAPEQDFLEQIQSRTGAARKTFSSPGHITVASHLSDTMCSYRTRVSAKIQSRIVHRQINNPLWLVFHLSFMHLNLYSPKSYTYVLKCLQKSQISPLPLGIPSKTCFLLKTTEKKKVQKKCILSPSPSHLVLQTIIREVCVFQRQKYFPLKIPPSSPVASEKAAEANTTARRKCGSGARRASGVSKRWRRAEEAGKGIWNGHRLKMPFSFSWTEVH